MQSMRAKKSLGQHFLRSRAVVGKIVRIAGVAEGDTVLEVGPGRGVLTAALLASGAHVVAVEADRGLIPLLQERFQAEIAAGRVSLVHEDIRRFIPTIGVEPVHRGSTPMVYSVVANIPYYLTGEIIRGFLAARVQPKSMTLLVQKEVAERAVGKVEGKDSKESLLSLSIKAYGVPKYAGKVGRALFSPVPKVDSAILHIDNIDRTFFTNTAAPLDEAAFFDLLHAGFAHKRKQLASNLASLQGREHVLRAFAEQGLNPHIRAEDLSIEKWRSLLISLKQNAEI